jgi:hypothetical protein
MRCAPHAAPLLDLRHPPSIPFSPSDCLPSFSLFLILLDALLFLFLMSSLGSHLFCSNKRENKIKQLGAALNYY